MDSLKDASGADASRRGRELQDTLKDAAQMEFRKSGWMPGKRRENAVQKIVEVHSPIQDRWVDDNIPELRREAEALGADAVALSEACSSASRQRAGAFGLSAGVTVRPPIPTDWVDINKGDSLRPNYRNRLVCHKRHLECQQSMWKTGRRRSLQLLRTRRSDCS